MLSILLGLINPLSSIAGKIADAYEARQKAETDRDKIAADERIKTLEARRDVLVSEAGTPLNTIVRACYSVPPAIYFAKIFVWDKTLGLGRTDDISNNQWGLVMAVIGFYFLYELAARFRR